MPPKGKAAGGAGAAPASAGKPARGKGAPPLESAAAIDDIFAAIPKGGARAAPAPAAAAAAAGAPGPRKRKAAGEAAEAPEGGGKPERRRREEEYFLDNGEKVVPVAAPRRFQDGLPVFKSFDTFSDFQAAQEGKPKAVGKCPFDCWCCF